MIQFTLNWFNGAVIANPNSINQVALYRQKSVGGAWLSTGFTPANNLPITAVTTTSPLVSENKIWEFKVQNICTVGGPIDNNNGIIEQLHFQCITPVLSFTQTTATAVLNVLGLDITKARFTLHKVSDDSVVFGPTIVLPVGNSITCLATGLTGSTGYYWEIDLYSTVNGAEIHSFNTDQLNSPCVSIDFITDASICSPITDLDATSIDIT